MPERTDIDIDESFDLSELPDDADVDFGHFELDEPVDVRITESLDEPIRLEGVEYVLGTHVHTELDDEDKAFRVMQSDEYDDITDVEDEITVAEVIHSDVDGGSGIKLLQVEVTEDDDYETLDDIIKEFADDSKSADDSESQESDQSNSQTDNDDQDEKRVAA